MPLGFLGSGNQFSLLGRYITVTVSVPSPSWLSLKACSFPAACVCLLLTGPLPRSTGCADVTQTATQRPAPSGAEHGAAAPVPAVQARHPRCVPCLAQPVPAPRCPFADTPCHGLGSLAPALVPGWSGEERACRQPVCVGSGPLPQHRSLLWQDGLAREHRVLAAWQRLSSASQKCISEINP